MIKNYVTSLFLTTVLTLLTISAFAKNSVIQIKSNMGKTEFHAIGKPKAIKIHGEGEGPSGQIKIKSGKISGHLSFKLKSLDTGIKLRDNHMKEKYLEVEKFPEAKLEITKFNGKPGEDGVSDFEGKLTLHGTTAPIKGEADVEWDDDEVSVEAKFKTQVKKHKIKSPSFAGVTMADDVNVEVSFKAPLP